MPKKSMTDWQRVEVALTNLDRVLLYGPPGTGKTYAAMRLGVARGKRVYSMTLTEDTPAEALRGHYLPMGEEWIWMDGPTTAAWRHGGRLVLNEIDHALGDALDWLHVVCDDPGFATVTLPKADHETITPAKGFQVVATMNGDPGDLPEALRDRFTPVFVGEVSPEAVTHLPMDLHKVAERLGAAPAGERVSIRRWKEFSILRNKVDADIAADIIFGSRARDLLAAIELASV